LGAASLAEGQKGVLFSGFFKLLVPFMMMIPGVIAFHLYGPRLSSFDQAYPQLIRTVLPVWMAGFFLAVLLGAVFSSFNSLLNSAATLFTLDIYAPMQKTPMSEGAMVKTAKIASIVIALISFCIAPLLYFSPDGLWQVIRVFTGFYNIPTIVIVIVGLFTARVPAMAAKIVIVFHVTAYALLRFVLDDAITLHFIHQYAILFVIELSIMLACGALYPRKSPWQFTRNQQVDLTPWTFARPLAVTLFSCVVALYLLFSPLGLASSEEFGVIYYICNAALLAGNVIVWILARQSVWRNAV
jgi:SSS family solute:Na+ symporter